jgi:hypothetical protein
LILSLFVLLTACVDGKETSAGAGNQGVVIGADSSTTDTAGDTNGNDADAPGSSGPVVPPVEEVPVDQTPQNSGTAIEEEPSPAQGSTSETSTSDPNEPASESEASEDPVSDTSSEPPVMPDPSNDQAENEDTSTAATIILAWQPSPDQVDSYRVHVGPTPETASTLLTVTTDTTVQYDSLRDLGLRFGDQSCFRVKAFNAATGESNFSDAVCFTLS